MSTPLETLDLAIEQFLRDTDQLNDGTFVTGWTVGISTSRIQADDEASLPMVTGTRYAFGPQTSMVQFAGIAKYLEVVSERAMWRAESNDDDD